MIFKVGDDLRQVKTYFLLKHTSLNLLLLFVGYVDITDDQIDEQILAS